MVVYLLVSYTKYFILKEHFNPLPSTAFLILSLISLALSIAEKPKASFVLFSFNVNLSVLFFNLYYPPDAGAYLYYFPLVVCAVLLNYPSFKDQKSVLYIVLFVFAFIGNFIFELPGIALTNLSPLQIKAIWYYDLVMSVVVTAILTFLLVHLVLKQSREIVAKNKNLITTQEALSIALKEKEILLAELHHRIKNNLAIMSGLLNLQIDSVTNEEARRIISDSKNRIQSLALVHNMLFENPVAKDVDLAKYTSSLISQLFYSYDLKEVVTISEEYDSVFLSVHKTVPIGLILNESITNSIKYVYKKNNSDPKFSISIKANGNDMVHLTLQDNGEGFPRDFNEESKNQSLGIFLIKSLAEQLNGEVLFSNDNGAKIQLSFTLAH
jgi:two-component sensor histidine kinase